MRCVVANKRRIGADKARIARGLRARAMATATLLLGALTLTSASPPDHPLTLMYIANEGVLVATGAHRILIDALFDAPNPEYAAPAPDLLDRLIGGEAPFHDVELLLVTHNHPDHFRASVVDRFLLGHSQTVLIAPVDVVQALRDSAEHWAAYPRKSDERCVASAPRSSRSTRASSCSRPDAGETRPASWERRPTGRCRSARPGGRCAIRRG